MFLQSFFVVVFPDGFVTRLQGSRDLLVAVT
jgi:hypothetical protein